MRHSLTQQGRPPMSARNSAGPAKQGPVSAWWSAARADLPPAPIGAWCGMKCPGWRLGLAANNRHQEKSGSRPVVAQCRISLLPRLAPRRANGAPVDRFSEEIGSRVLGSDAPKHVVIAFLCLTQHFQQWVGAVGKADVVDVFVVVVVATFIVMGSDVALDGVAGFMAAAAADKLFQHADCIGGFSGGNDADFGI